MSDQTTKKKDFLQPEIAVEPPITSPQINKLKPNKCLLSLRYTTDSEKDYKDLTVKRKYYRKLYLSGDPWSSKSNKTFLKTYKKMKYVQGLEIKRFSSFYDSFFKRMSNFREAMIDLALERTLCEDKQVVRKARVDLIRNGQKLKRLNLISFKIRMKHDGWTKPEELSPQFTSIMKGIIYMSSLKEFTIEVEKSRKGFRRDFSEDQPFIPTKVSSRFKRLKKIERLKLSLHDFPARILNHFIEDFGYFPNLKSVDFTSLDQVHGKELLQHLSSIQSLTSVTLRQFAEPNELILLASKVPSLRTITIKTDWIFSQFTLPALELTKDQIINLQQLHIYVPLKIDRSWDANLVANFVEAFPQLRSLILDLEAKNDKNILSPIGKAINRLQRLEEIQLSVLVRLPGIQSPLLSSLDNLKELRKITLGFTKTINQGWDKDIKDTHQAMRTLLLTSKKLEHLRIRWEGFTKKCFEHLSLIIDEMNQLKAVELEYKPAHTDHGAVHKEILKSIEEYFSKTNTKIKIVVVKASCTPVRGKSCEETVQDVNEAVQSNKNLEKFVLEPECYRFICPF